MKNNNQIDLLERIEHITNGLPTFASKQLTQHISTENAHIIIEYIKCQKTESNISDGYKNLVIKSLVILIKYGKISEIDRDTISGEVLRRRLVETGKFQYNNAAMLVERMFRFGTIDRVSYDTYRRKK